MPANPESFQKIQHFVVLMLENRSFDHLIGSLRTIDPRVAGLTGSEFNCEDPNSPTTPVAVRKATSYVMPFDPPHEFLDVQMQLYGPTKDTPEFPQPPTDPAPMSGFVVKAMGVAKSPSDAGCVMEYFGPDQAPVMSALAREFALFNYWHSSLPGPTWPNRFFVHAATSGGLVDSPGADQIIQGFSFPNGTIYERLTTAGKYWRIYHDGIPQTAGIDSLRLEFVNPLTLYFRWMDAFEHDIGLGNLPEYTFIEPNYDTGHNYQNGNSMHPLNDIRKGELLVKRVYEAIRNSPYWENTMLIVTFDEHGGFYDHVPPCPTVPTGDDGRYSNKEHPFGFDLLGVRVPTIVISAFTERGTIVGTDPADPKTQFDHSSVLATIEKRFGLPPLTKRDASANTLDVVVNLDSPRNDAPTSLATFATASLLTRIADLFRPSPEAASENAPLSENQKSMVALAAACDLKLSPPSQHPAILARHDGIQSQKEAADYIAEVKDKIRTARPQ